MNPSYQINYDATHQYRITSQGLGQNNVHSAFKLRPAKRYIIQLICYLLQVMIVICQQLEMIHQDIRQFLIQVRRIFKDDRMTSYRHFGVSIKPHIRFHHGLSLACRTFSLSLFAVFAFGVTWMFHQAGF